MGGGAGLGIQDGCAYGGAVSRFVIEGRHSRRVWLRAVVMVGALSLACTRQHAQSTPDASSLLQAVPPADPAKMPSLEEAKHWSNPYLVIRPETVGLLTDVTANEERILKPDEVLNALAELPRSAWPYGRAVAILVDAKPTSSEEEKAALRRNRGIVAGELQSAHVAINWISHS